jgi:hypothetical protein
MCGALFTSWIEVLWVEPFNIAVEPVDPSSSTISPTFPSSHLTVLLTGKLVMITFTSYKCFGLVDVVRRGIQQGEKEMPLMLSSSPVIIRVPEKVMSVSLSSQQNFW